MAVWKNISLDRYGGKQNLKLTDADLGYRRLLAKKSIETGEDCDAIPESYKNYLADKALVTNALLPRIFITRGGSMAGYGNRREKGEGRIE